MKLYAKEWRGNGVDWPTTVGVWALCAIGLMVIVLVAACLLDFAAEYRSFDARVACEAKQMQPRRQMLSVRVTCIPVQRRPSGSDSLRVEVVK